MHGFYRYKCPNTFDETVALDGKVGEYASPCTQKRRHMVCGSNDRTGTARDLALDFSFLGATAIYQATVFKDGMNADRDGTDYKKEVIKISGGR
jgi:alpha-glucosidase